MFSPWYGYSKSSNKPAYPAGCSAVQANILFLLFCLQQSKKFQEFKVPRANSLWPYRDRFSINPNFGGIVHTLTMAEKVDPFKRESAKPEPLKKHSSLDGEITIKLSPRRLLRGSLLIMMLIAVFYVGRFSVGAAACQLPSFSLPDFSGLFSSDDASPSGLATAEVNETKETEVKLEELQPAPVNGSAEQEESPETFASAPYSKVALAVDDIYLDWKGTWGKIKGLSYTVKNNEAGTVKPHHFVMVVEGYDDIEKKFDVSYTSQKVKAGETLKDEAAVSGGFAYSPKQIPDGDLTKVRISLFLQDASDNLIAVVHKDVDLSGN